MRTGSKFMGDTSRLMVNAMGVAQGAREEAKTAMRSLIDLAGRPGPGDPRGGRRGARHGPEGAGRQRGAQGANRGAEEGRQVTLVYAACADIRAK